MDVRLAHDVFAPHVRTSFSNNENGLELQLIEVSDRRLSPQFESFSLLFRGPRTPPLAQAEYPLDHSVIGSFRLFIVPVGTDPEGLLYEAVISRLRDDGG